VSSEGTTMIIDLPIAAGKHSGKGSGNERTADLAAY
jgi:hypothetical protein